MTHLDEFGMLATNAIVFKLILGILILGISYDRKPHSMNGTCPEPAKWKENMANGILWCHHDTLFLTEVEHLGYGKCGYINVFTGFNTIRRNQVHDHRVNIFN
jgi:hypothetical protein